MWKGELPGPAASPAPALLAGRFEVYLPGPQITALPSPTSLHTHTHTHTHARTHTRQQEGWGGAEWRLCCAY